MRRRPRPAPRPSGPPPLRIPRGRPPPGPPDGPPGDAGVRAHAPAGQPAVLPRAAALCDGELVPLDEAEGRIASQLLVPYPPGIPVLIPGLRITRPMIRLIQDVIAQSGVDAVHGLCTRGKRPFVEVLNHDEAQRLTTEPAER